MPAAELLYLYGADLQYKTTLWVASYQNQYFLSL